MPEELDTSEAPDPRSSGTPKHLWVVGIVSLLWNAVGAMDYFMTQTENESYMSGFTPEQLEFFYGFPTWLVAFWAIAVWGGVLGSVLLLLKRRLAIHVFLASFLAMVVTTIHNFGFANGFEVIGDGFALTFTAVIFFAALALFIYARAMGKRGVLV
jgi:hypothetical protein